LTAVAPFMKALTNKAGEDQLGRLPTDVPPSTSVTQTMAT
jgi:hypothetical protein